MFEILRLRRKPPGSRADEERGSGYTLARAEISYKRDADRIPEPVISHDPNETFSWFLVVRTAPDHHRRHVFIDGTARVW